MSEPTQYVQYLYDAAGQRVKKLNRKQTGANWDAVVYIDGVLELRTQKRGATTKQGLELHVLDGQKRLGRRRSGDSLDSKPDNLLVLGDHLGSAHVELDWSLGSFVDREEFRPYGETSFGSYANKRYRFTGKERDEESGLNYHGARYYSPGLARWMSPDPKGLVDGVNLYGYVRGNPVGLSDPTGMESEHNDPSMRSSQSSVTGTNTSASLGGSPPSTAEYNSALRRSFVDNLGKGSIAAVAMGITARILGGTLTLALSVLTMRGDTAEPISQPTPGSIAEATEKGEAYANATLLIGSLAVGAGVKTFSAKSSSTTIAYRWGNANNPNEFLPRISKEHSFSERIIEKTKLNFSEKYKLARAEAHERGDVSKSGFVSVVTDINRATGTNDPWPQGIISKSPHLMQFKVPSDRLIKPQSSLSCRETEHLFFGSDPKIYLISTTPNPFKR